MNNNYLKAIATMVGTVIGVGIFSIPFVVAKAGILSLFIFLPCLAFIQYLFHNYYAEIILATGEKHRLPGYTAKYFGGQAKNVVLFFVLLSGYGSMLAYILVGGSFFHQLFSPIFGGSQFFYTLIIYSTVAVLVFYGLKLIAKVDELLAMLMLLAVALVIGKSFSSISMSNFHLADWSYFFLPYGPIFFAVGGDAAVPEVCRLLENDRRLIKKALCWGTMLPALVTFLFVMAVVGVSGGATTPDTLSGLAGFLPAGVVNFALVFGSIAVITCFINFAQAIKETYIWDLKINKKISWLLALLPSFLLYLAGFHNLTSVVSLTGSVTGGILGIVLIWLFFKVKNSSPNGALVELKLSKLSAILLSLLFVVGFIYSLANIL